MKDELERKFLGEISALRLQTDQLRAELAEAKYHPGLLCDSPSLRILRRPSHESFFVLDCLSHNILVIPLGFSPFAFG
eukprot:m.676221 g.676221  ORF g.676221 m.676221 type:complete len:78 (-) comp58557_c0_seq10:47-280(-)